MGIYFYTSARMLVEIFSAFDNSKIHYLSRGHEFDDNYRTSQHFDLWLNSFPDDVFRNGCANQKRVHFVVFPRLFGEARRRKQSGARLRRGVCEEGGEWGVWGGGFICVDMDKGAYLTKTFVTWVCFFFLSYSYWRME